MNTEENLVFEEISDEMGWDDVISEESSFTLLPEGDYDFKVTKFDRARFNGSDKIRPCPKAILTLSVSGKEGTTVITENLLLTKTLEWKLSQFFISIGMKKHGEELKMNWSQVVGATGRCHVVVNKWKNDKGEEKQNNRVDKYLEPEAAETSASASSWKAGRF